MDNGAYGRPPYRLPEKFGLADTIGRKPRCEVGVFIFGQPGFHNAAAVGCVVFLSHGRDLLSCRMSAAGIICGASRIAGFGEGTPQQVSREGQNRRIADFGTGEKLLLSKLQTGPVRVFPYIERTGRGFQPAVRCLFLSPILLRRGLCFPLAALFFFSPKDTFEKAVSYPLDRDFSKFLLP